jgi:hypothetical protein
MLVPQPRSILQETPPQPRHNPREGAMGQGQASSPDAPRPPESQATGPPPGRPGRAAAPAPRGAPPAAPPRPPAAPPPRCHWRRRLLPPSPEPKQRPAPPLGFCTAGAGVFLGKGRGRPLFRRELGLGWQEMEGEARSCGVGAEKENGGCAESAGGRDPPSNTGPGGSGPSEAASRGVGRGERLASWLALCLRLDSDSRNRLFV